MARESRREAFALALEQELEEKPWRFDFFEAMRRLECAHPEAPRWGDSRTPLEEPELLGQSPKLTFAPAALDAFEKKTKFGKPKLLVRLFGLWGPHGALPTHWTALAESRANHHNDTAMVDFIDMLQHRFISYFYRAWSCSRPTCGLDRPDDDRFADYAGAIGGLGPETQPSREEHWGKLFFSGLMAGQTRHADGLQMMVEAFLGMPVQVESFVGEWCDLADGEIPPLACRGEESPRLGSTAMLGSRFWSRQNRFRLHVGPLDYREYQALQSGEGAIERVAGLIHQYVGRELAWDVQLVLHRDHVPPWRLSDARGLGFDTWLPGGATTDHARDTIVRVPH
jgi:type VI secretion system protein ImpH